MKVSSKYKVCKRLGNSVFEKCQTQKYMLSESRSSKSRGGRRPRALSDYAKQLLEKQRMRFTYGISEKQFAGYIKEAMNQGKTDPQSAVVAFIESRLDNVVYRMGLGKTRRLSRQLVSHGHILVNGRKVTVPSYRTKAGDKIEVREGSRNRAYFQNLGDQELSVSADWVSFDIKKLSGEVKSVPTPQNTELHSDLTEVLAFYSR